MQEYRGKFGISSSALAEEASESEGGVHALNEVVTVRMLPPLSGTSQGSGKSALPPKDFFPGAARVGEDFWLEGGVLACICPGCGGPMSVRLWLRLADCFRCHASVQLTEEQIRLAEGVLKRHRQGEVAAVVSPEQIGCRPGSFQAAGSVPSIPAAARAKLRYRARPWRTLWHPPSWVISGVIHAILLIIFSFLTVPGTGSPAITITTTISWEDQPGEELIYEENPILVFEAPQLDPAAIEIAGLEELGGFVDVPVPPVDPPPATVPEGTGPASEVPEVLPPAMRPGGMLSGRDPAFRMALALQRGGSEETEAAVARGLAWLARHQNANGSWSLDKFHLAPRATSGPGDGLGSVFSDSAGTALALLPFLGAGQTHKQGEYREVVHKGLRWLIYHQGPDGDLRGLGSGRMYAHGMAAIVLCEAYAMTGDDQLRGPAQRAVDFIVQAQHPAGGWRYDPGQPGDTSIVGWQLMALQSARLHYLLHVPEDTLKLAQRFLDSVQADYLGATYGYMPGSAASPAMTAEALLCRLYLGWNPNDRRIRTGVQWLLTQHCPAINNPNYYYWYYGTLVMHHVGGTAFRNWNYRLKPILLELQEKTGRNAGSWPPVGAWGVQGGRIFSTSLAICMLEVYYRHMPLNRSEAIEIGQKMGKPGEQKTRTGTADTSGL